MRSFIKIYGPPVLDAITALEKVAIGFPEVCIMDTIIAHGISDFLDDSGAMNYLSNLPFDIPVERCNTIISKSGTSLGEYDFYFEWFVEPDLNQIKTLIKKIDEALSPLGCKYTITTEK